MPDRPQSDDSAGEPATTTLALSETTYPCEDASVPRARHFVRQIALIALSRDAAAALELAASEVVTNAVRHGGRGDMHVRVVRMPDAVRVAVRSVCGDSSSPHVRNESVDGLDDYGRGLILVEGFVDAWDWEKHEDGTITVWCEKNR